MITKLTTHLAELVAKTITKVVDKMPKYCSAPNCNHDSGNSNAERKSYYKFPLHDPDRLTLWLKNMGREDWSPSKHQYICNEHFESSCFNLRWGIRYLENNAIPTVFQLTKKRKGEDHRNSQKCKRTQVSRKRRATISSDIGVVLSGDPTDCDAASTVTLYEVTVNPLEAERLELQEKRDAAGCTVDIPAAMSLSALEEDSSDGDGGGFPVTLYQTMEDLGGGEEYGGLDESGEVLVVVSEPQPEVRRNTAAFVSEGNDLGTMEDVSHFVVSPMTLFSKNVSPVMTETELSISPDDHTGRAQIIAYFETIPNVVSTGGAQVSVPPDTVLSSALSPSPIVSTLPIVSKHTALSPGSLILTLERRGTEGETPEEDSVEEPGSQLEEHRYHKNSLSREQLEAIVVELQKKVKVLQQRHRRHLDKLLGLENTVSQLRQNNLLNEERLQLLERAYIQASAAVSEAGETVAIIYEEDNTAYFYEG
ncbi:hypothetical protein UPYG_G00193910 [Umbra pygmaea]|uniref:THAP-type domain-containing protein n=1 Tax=Umbra pygmaea TaxID=75934 RepID=A0ABD0X4L3_UMBPY